MSSTLDHITPISQGGRNSPDNMVLCCRPCNTAKADKTEAEPTATQKRLWRDYKRDA